MKALQKFKEWFRGDTDIPSSVWYALGSIGAAIYITSIIINSLIINH